MVTAAQRRELQGAEDLELAKKAAYIVLAHDLMESAVSSAGKAIKQSERQAEIEFLLDPQNPCIALLSLSDETVDRIVDSIEDNTLPWYQ